MHSIVAGAALDLRAIPGLQAWWRAQDCLITSGAIETWYDLSGRGRTLTQSDPSRRMTRATDVTYGGRLVAISDGGDWYDGTAWSQSQPLTIYAVCEVTSLGYYETILDTTGGGRVILRSNTGVRWAPYGGSAELVVPTVDSRDPALVWCVYNGASTEAGANSATATVSGNGGSNALNTPRIGAGPANVYPIGNGGRIADISIFAGAHDAATRARALRFLAAHYKLPLS